MKYYHLSLLVIQVTCYSFPKKFCDIESDGLTKQCFLKETLVSMAHSPNQLAVDTTTNDLYFSFDSGQGEYIPVKVNVDTKKVTVMKGIKDAFAVAYDSTTKEIYFGGSYGIYNYSPAKKLLRRLAIGNLDIWWLFVKKNIFFIKFPSLNAFYYVNKTVKYVHRLKTRTMHQFVYDNDENIFFINSTGLYGLKNNSNEAVMLRDSPRFLGMTLDNKGQLYLCSEDAIYVLSKIVQKVKRLVNVQGVLGLTFDKNNNMIYSDSHDVVRLLVVSNDNYYDALNSVTF
ncbi:unnamed protein product [Diatraea saccharalis]|uniref:Ommochrome-binding protein-like n=1 Tax=Diatraea saccharalis TaxID=40085 RepID=A0A9N9R3M1_9NEOP|nr:unnamed protein product [Diatraea saccharalis]